MFIVFLHVLNTLKLLADKVFKSTDLRTVLTRAEKSHPMYTRPRATVFVRRRSAHHGYYCLSARELELTLMQLTILPSTRLNRKQNFQTVVKSILMNLYLNQ